MELLIELLSFRGIVGEYGGPIFVFCFYVFIVAYTAYTKEQARLIKEKHEVDVDAIALSVIHAHGGALRDLFHKYCSCDAHAAITLNEIIKFKWVQNK